MDAERRGRGSSVGVAVGLATQQVGKREGGRFSISLHQLSTLEIEAQRVENVTRVCDPVLNRRSSTDYNIFITTRHLWIHFAEIQIRQPGEFRLCHESQREWPAATFSPGP